MVGKHGERLRHALCQDLAIAHRCMLLRVTPEFTIPELGKAVPPDPHATLHAITGDENVFILAPRPGDETLLFGGLIAEACARGRPPFVGVLTDGSARGPALTQAERAAGWERSVRRALALLGLPSTRLLMVGLYDDTVPREGPVFDAVVRAVTLVMWARDCNVICVPWQDDGVADRRAARVVAEAVAARSGVALIYAGTTAGSALRLDIRPHLSAMQAAANEVAPGVVIPTEPSFFREPGG